MASFMRLPGEIRIEVLKRLIDHWRIDGDKGSIAAYTSVCREWQAEIERYTFKELHLSHTRMEDFGNIVKYNRRRCLERINLLVDLPEYENDPCEERETWEDKMANNQAFTRTFRDLFAFLAAWSDDDVCRDGIYLYLNVSSKSDLRNSGFELWQRRRWNVKDIGEKRFADSYIDFIGQDEEHNRTRLLRPVHAITSFETDSLIRRSIMPEAYSDIVAMLPRLRELSLDVIKERRLAARREMFDRMYSALALFKAALRGFSQLIVSNYPLDFGTLLDRWWPSLESLTIGANTISTWRQLPHESASEGDTGEVLCHQLRVFAVQLKQLKINNLVRIREFLRPAWPSKVEDKDPFLENMPFPKCPKLKVLHLSYGAIHYKPDWHSDSPDINEHEDTVKFRQSIALAAGRIANRMPALEHMVVSQRPMMWAGKYQIEYKVTETGPELVITTTFEFTPWERTVECWTAVAKAHTGKDLKHKVVVLPNWQTDGTRPLTPAVSF
jgi:hypothetical protein